LAIEEKLVREHPATINYRGDLASTYFGLGNVLRAKGRHTQAREAHQKALEIRERLVQEHGVMTQLAADLGRSYRVLRQQSDSDPAAMEWFSKPLRTLEGVLQREPHDYQARGDLRAALEGRAQALDLLGRKAEGRADRTRAAEMAGGGSPPSGPGPP